MPNTDTRAPTYRGLPRTAAAAALAAVWTYALGIGMASGRQPPGYDAARQSATDLLITGGPFRWLAAASFVVTGCCLLVLALAFPRPASWTSRAVLALAGGAVLLLGTLPRTSGAVHVPTLVCGLVAVGALACWPAAMAPNVRAARRFTGVLLALVAGLGVAALGGAGVGAYERFLSLALLAVVAAGTLRAWWRAGHRVGSAPVRMALAAAVLGAVALLVGILTTVILPARVSMTYLDIRLALSPQPADVGRVIVPTVLGDIEARFAGIAPGVRANPQVTADLTRSLGGADASLGDLQPSQAELDHAIRDAAVGLGVRFGAGALLAVLLAVVLRAAIARRPPGLRTLLTAACALVLAVLAVAGSMVQSYRGAAPKELKGTGLLGAIQENAGIFEDVATRSEQVAPYLRNVLALSAALRERYVPQPIGTDRVLRILLVSDIHAGNQYPLLKTLVDSEQVDVVIDCGDLLNFGTVAEGEVSGVFDGIASLGVPYVFVRGNHDATGPADDAVLRRLDGIRNVILLQPDASRYEQLTISGVRIAGFNDPRWFGDDGQGSAAKQQPARERWLASFADREVPDLVVSHEPWAVQGIEGAGVLLNGHMHSTFREGNRVQVGTFTGGGPFSHYLTGESGQELVGQPSAFDVLDIGSACRVVALTRYRYAGVVEGRPVFDDVALVNGAVIDTRPVDPARTCSSDLPPTSDTVPGLP